MRLWPGVLVLGALAFGCIDSPSKGAVNSPEWTAHNVKGYVETVAGPEPEMAYGWDLHLTSQTARWRECTSAEQCGDVLRERPAKDVVGFARVGRIERDDGHEVDVFSISLAPHKRYVVPERFPL